MKRSKGQHPNCVDARHRAKRIVSMCLNKDHHGVTLHEPDENLIQPEDILEQSSSLIDITDSLWRLDELPNLDLSIENLSSKSAADTTCSAEGPLRGSLGSNGGIADSCLATERNSEGTPACTRLQPTSIQVDKKRTDHVAGQYKSRKINNI
ncbi:hypothetical protein MSG28_012375 [Choristoneura fumiferana]|uniref:Uncharacterized protein n=1 Tax=Choristoneura fumiferana TaxID=7141 RepID=A0ACC0KDK4_CHOFU|nr:hypothetical protein MSG28_012375 [Choristoneura fumiferana]